MTGKKYDDKMKLDMPFGEALERFIGVEPNEMHANVKKAKKKRPPGGKKLKPPGDQEAQNVVKLRGKRKPNHD